MNSIKLLDRRIGYFIAAFTLVFATILPAAVSAAQVSDRSIAVSSASADADNVSYKVSFKAAAAAGAFVVEFCQNSPILTLECTPAPGFSAAGAATTTPDYTVANKDATKVFITSAITAGEDVSVDLTGINNPTSAGALYARVATYTNAAGAAGYTSTDPNVVAPRIDDGGMAIAITNSIGVSGAVLETITFCIAKSTITAGCDLSGNQAPVLELGETVGTTKALVPGTISTDSMFTQISTNAVGGAVVNLKSSALGCGGLMRAGATSCDIAPALTSGIAENANQSRFGVRVATATDTGINPSGTFQAANGYNASTYVMNFTALDASGVTSVYGDQILNTDGLPANNKNAQLTFGATVSNTTPAGKYSADLSMIATGKF